MRIKINIDNLVNELDYQYQSDRFDRSSQSQKIAIIREYIQDQVTNYIDTIIETQEEPLTQVYYVGRASVWRQIQRYFRDEVNAIAYLKSQHG